MLESISIGFGDSISLEDLNTLFERCRVKVFVNGEMIADPVLMCFQPVGDWNRFDLEYKIKPGDRVTADFETVPPFTTTYGLTINAALSIRGSIETEIVERTTPDSSSAPPEAKP